MCRRSACVAFEELLFAYEVSPSLATPLAVCVRLFISWRMSVLSFSLSLSALRDEYRVRLKEQQHSRKCDDICRNSPLVSLWRLFLSVLQALFLSLSLPRCLAHLAHAGISVKRA